MTFNLGDLFSSAAKTVPDRTAVIYGDLRVAYRELDERSDRLAAGLARRGVKRGTSVGLLLYNSPAHLEFMMAVWKLGAVSFNLNYRYESEELQHVVDDARGFALITEPDLAPMVGSLRARLPQLELVVIADYAAPLASQAGQLTYSELVDEAVGTTDISAGRSDEDFLLLYTGGTTGRPKGVEWTHKNLFLLRLGPAHCFVQDSPSNHRMRCQNA